MARTVEQIQNELLSSKSGYKELNTLDSTSKVSIWRLLMYVVATGIYTLENLFDKHRDEIKAYILNNKQGTAIWYRNITLLYQKGFTFDVTTGLFSDKLSSGVKATEQQIADSKIIKYASINEANQTGSIYIKVATEDTTTNELKKLGQSDINGLEAYLSKVKIAGTKVIVSSSDPAELFITMDIYYEPDILDSNGVDLTSGVAVVKDAISNYLKNLSFNGYFVVQGLVDALQLVNGVRLIDIKQISLTEGGKSKIMDAPEFISDSGYFIYDKNSTTNYKINVA